MKYKNRRREREKKPATWKNHNNNSSQVFDTCAKFITENFVFSRWIGGICGYTSKYWNSLVPISLCVCVCLSVGGCAKATANLFHIHSIDSIQNKLHYK